MAARLSPPSLLGKGAGGLGNALDISHGTFPRRGGEGSPLRFGVPVLFFLAALILAPVAHGCHGADEDHEPVGVPRVETDPPPPSS